MTEISIWNLTWKKSTSNNPITTPTFLIWIKKLIFVVESKTEKMKQNIFCSIILVMPYVNNISKRKRDNIRSHLQTLFTIYVIINYLIRKHFGIEWWCKFLIPSALISLFLITTKENNVVF